MLYRWLKEQQCVINSEWTTQHSCYREQHYSVEHKKNITKSLCEIVKHIRLLKRANNENHTWIRNNGIGASVPPGLGLEPSETHSLRLL